MIINLYQVDAFSNKPFGGNPAAVCPLNEWLPDELLQQIAMENNLSETAFLVKQGKDYQIRWFTPTVEVDLCGHATLASAAVIFHEWNFSGEEIIFHSKSGPLPVKKALNGRLTLNFPVLKAELSEAPPSCILEGLDLTQAAVYKGAFDYMVIAENQQQVEQLSPDFQKIAGAECRGVVVTSRGNQSDFVSRCFYPQSGINEDPVTGSAHTMMVPYWAGQLGKNKLSAIQLSQRKGYLDCELAGDRVYMTGSAIIYLRGEIDIVWPVIS